MLRVVTPMLLGLACIPLIYYLLALFSSWLFFRRAQRATAQDAAFTPPVSCLKPIKGLDGDAYENFASFCRQDYPNYEVIFCVDLDDPARPVLERLVKDFPGCSIRLLFGSGRTAINDKVARLVRLTNEARHDIFVITDGDVRVSPDYLRSVVAPFRDPKVGAATCLYASTRESTFLENLQSISMASDFFAGILVAWKLDGVKFTLAQTIVARRQSLDGFGGYPILEDRPADDLYIGRLVAEQGYEVKLLPYVVHTVADFGSLRELFHKRVRWMTVMRCMRPWGHLGLALTWGLPWAILAVAVHPTWETGAFYFGAYLVLRTAMAWMIGARGMKQTGIWKRIPLIPLWDALAFAVWLTSFACRTIRWRGIDYFLRGGRLWTAAGNAPNEQETADA